MIWFVVAILVAITLVFGLSGLRVVAGLFLIGVLVFAVWITNLVIAPPRRHFEPAKLERRDPSDPKVDAVARAKAKLAEGERRQADIDKYFRFGN
jgi:ABC-type transport system involved in cytochrome bd biosynthesis fused ATPase/permease subunit